MTIFDLFHHSTRSFHSIALYQNYVILYTSDHGQTLAEHGQVCSQMKPDKVIVDVAELLVVGEQYDRKNLKAGIPPGIRVFHLNNFATLLDLIGVPMSLRVRPYDKSIFSLTAEDNRVRHYMTGSLRGLGDYVVSTIPTPLDEAGAFRDLSTMVPSLNDASGSQDLPAHRLPPRCLVCPLLLMVGLITVGNGGFVGRP